MPPTFSYTLETKHGLLMAFLLEAGISVYPVNPKTANARRKAAGANTDRSDARLLAKAGRFGLSELRRLSPDSTRVAELKTLTRDQDALIQTQTRLVTQLTACLKEYYPAALKVFGKLQQRSTLLFLPRSPTPEAAAHASLEAITTLLTSSKYPRARQAAKAQEILEEWHRPHLMADEVIARAKARLTLALVRQVLPLLEEIKSDDKEMRVLFLKHPEHELWKSLPRAAKRLAQRLLAEWGDDRGRYQDAQSVPELAGTAPVPFESGNDAKAHTRVACLKPLRNGLYQFAWQTTFSQSWAATYSQRKRAEGKSHSRAIRALANVWVRIISRMWHDHTCYQAAVFEAAKLAHAKRAA